MFIVSYFKKLRSIFCLFLVLFPILATSTFKTSFAECHPRDHAGFEIKQFGFAGLVDSIVTIISNLIFGEITDSVGNENSVAPDFNKRNWQNGIVYKMFMGITQNARFQVVFYLAVILYVSYLGFSFAMGTAQFSAKDLIERFIKIGVIVFFITPTGWEAYLELIVKNVVGASRYFNRAIIASMYNVPIDKIYNPFQPIDMVFSVLFHEVTWIKIAALLFSGSFLFIILLLLVFVLVILTCLMVLVKVGILYATTIIISAVLLSIGPIFFILLLFQTTSSYFQKWVTNLVGLFMQQYMLFLGFFIFCLIITNLIKGMFYFEICKAPVISLNFMVRPPKFLISILDVLLGIIRVVTFGFVKIKNPFADPDSYLIYESVVLLRYFKPIGMAFDLPSDIFTAGGLLIVTLIFGKFTDTVMNLGSEIAGGGVSASNVVPKAINDKLNNYQSAINSAMLDQMKDTVLVVPQILKTADSIRSFHNKMSNYLKEPETGGIRNKIGRFLAKGVKGALTPGKYLADKARSVVLDDEDNERNSVAIHNNKVASDVMKEEMKRLADEGVTSASELTDAQKKEINDKIIVAMKSRGNTGIVGDDGKPVKFDDLEKDKQDALLNDAMNREVKFFNIHNAIITQSRVTQAKKLTFEDALKSVNNSDAEARKESNLQNAKSTGGKIVANIKNIKENQYIRKVGGKVKNVVKKMFTS